MKNSYKKCPICGRRGIYREYNNGTEIAYLHKYGKTVNVPGLGTVGDYIAHYDKETMRLRSTQGD